jgi:hypothetical protein
MQCKNKNCLHGVADWTFAVTSLVLEGLFGILVTFLLIVTTSDVVELLFNFTAIEFVSMLDETAFFLSKQVGFAGRSNKMAAKTVEETKYEVLTEKMLSHLAKAIFLVASFVILFGGWLTIYYFQLNGEYFSTKPILVQFDDAIGADFGA